MSASDSAVPRPSTLPCPKIANTPGNSGTSVPSSSTPRCATSQRTSACAVVNLMRCRLCSRFAHAHAPQLMFQGLQLGAAGHLAGQLLDGDLRLLRRAEAAAALEDQEPVAHRIGV